MRDMATGHKQTVITDLRKTTAASCSSVHRDVFTDAVTLANDQFGLFAAELFVLRNFTDHSERVDQCVFTDHRIASDDHVAFQSDAFFKYHFGADVAKRADGTSVSNLRTLFDDRAWMNDSGAHAGISIMAVNSASAAISPSTSATPLNFQTLPPGLPRTVVRRIFSWSPGTTLRRNLQPSIAMK